MPLPLSVTRRCNWNLHVSQFPKPSAFSKHSAPCSVCVCGRGGCGGSDIRYCVQGLRLRHMAFSSCLNKMVSQEKRLTILVVTNGYATKLQNTLSGVTAQELQGKTRYYLNKTNHTGLKMTQEVPPVNQQKYHRSWKHRNYRFSHVAKQKKRELV